MKRRKKLQNYILLILLFAASISLVFYLCKLYDVQQEEQKRIPVISGMLQEIYPEDLEHYILDNPQAIVYMCVANDDTCRSYEKSFRKLLKKRENNDSIIYLNLTDVDQDQFIKEFNERYHYKMKLTKKYPAFVVWEEGEIEGVLQGSEKKPLTIRKTTQFLELYEIGE